MADGGRPVLWHIPISHYSEKVRWALDYKGVEHERRAPTTPPGAHMLVSLWRTRGRHKTFPLVLIDGRAIGDSTAIIAALEARWPEPPLYPEDPADRARALELEDWFDEEVGPHTRLLGWHEVLRDPDSLAEIVEQEVPPALGRLPGGSRFAARSASLFAGLRYSVKSEERAERARARVLEAFDRLESELDGGEYLVGERFSVADLTAASLLYPLVSPPEAPQLPPPPESYERFRAPLKERPGYRWVEEMFRRHRSRGGALKAEPAAIA
jgi:glutathione S-transferase